jgi:predicted KAP-like P-loop ATPase
VWADNETDRDFLNFTGVADGVAEMIRQANGPISIGVSGQWGVGKSSMIRLIRKALEDSAAAGGRKFVFVEFNAWLYQGFDDARAALMDVIASTLADKAKGDETLVSKAKDLLRRVKWLRVGKLVATSAVSMALGFSPTGLLGGALKAGKKLLGDAEDKGEDDDDAKENDDDASGLLEDVPSPPKQIQALRDSFEDILQKLDVTLVVLIDDLDRCLPETTISTLEAIRLFLFLKNTAFVIAADEVMIKHAVSRHFSGIADKQVVNYFDKLIQVPVRVPPLGTQEVRAYLYLLFIESSSLDQPVKDAMREAIGRQLRETWQGKRVDQAFLQASRDGGYGEDLQSRFDTADRLSSIMTRASGIQGNPRLIKRFLNALSIRMSLARTQGVNVDESVLAKLMLFERLGNETAYEKLISAVSASSDGKATFLAPWEANAGTDGFVVDDPLFNDRFVNEWLQLEPPLAEKDLRGAVFVSRDHLPIISAESGLSGEGADLLAVLLANPSTANAFATRIAALSRSDVATIMDRLLAEAKNEREWGAPDILTACLALADASDPQAKRLAAFLSDLPPAQIRASVVPKIDGRSWTDSVYTIWSDDDDVSGPVKRAIRAARR